VRLAGAHNVPEMNKAFPDDAFDFMRDSCAGIPANVIKKR